LQCVAVSVGTVFIRQIANHEAPHVRCVCVCDVLRCVMQCVAVCRWALSLPGRLLIMKLSMLGVCVCVCVA